MPDATTVLITGARGNLGAKLRAHLEASGAYRLRLIDQEAGDGVVGADLANADEGWARHFEGVDAVIHFAGHPSPKIDWATAQRLNIDMTLNVYDVAARHGVGRVVFASSNWVMAGYRFTEDRLTTDLPPRPINPYGISKLVGERAGLSLSRRGVSFIGVRIGYTQRDDNRPGPEMGMGEWGQHMWLSNRDLVHGFERAILARDVPFAVLNMMSDNRGMRWDIEETRRVIGYAPQDGHAPQVTAAQVSAADTLREKYGLAEALERHFAPGDW